jgi:hypothetical protein
MIGDFQRGWVEIRSKARAPDDTSLFVHVNYSLCQCPCQSDVKRDGALRV